MPTGRWRGPLTGSLMAMALIGTMVGGASAVGARHAAATIVDGSGTVVGRASFTQDAAGRLHVNVHVIGMSPGRHGTHLHAVGSCVGPAFTSAGGHHNPLDAQHGLDNPDGAHAGDLPNLAVNDQGRGRLQAVSDRATLTDGPTSLFDRDGSAIVIHALADDQATNPTGNSGARIACGVITAQ